jgi:curved DNA-binding protein CbpA
MADYYVILGLEPSCSQRDIKRAFREKAKRLHPDVAGSGKDSQEQMRVLLEAYQALSDSELRREYDRRFRKTFERYSFDYRTFLRSRAYDPVSASKLVFYDLLHGWEEEALEVYDRLNASGDFVPDDYMDREDAMDCAFILAEEYEKRERFLEAFGLYRYCIGMERKKPYFRHFYPEILMRIKELIRLRLPRAVGPDQLLDCLAEMIGLGLPKRETAQFHRQRAETEFKLGRLEDARTDLEAALALDRKIPGVQYLKKWTGIE